MPIIKNYPKTPIINWHYVQDAGIKSFQIMAVSQQNYQEYLRELSDQRIKIQNKSEKNNGTQ